MKGYQYGASIIIDLLIMIGAIVGVCVCRKEFTEIKYPAFFLVAGTVGMASMAVLSAFDQGNMSVEYLSAFMLMKDVEMGHFFNRARGAALLSMTFGISSLVAYLYIAKPWKCSANASESP